MVAARSSIIRREWRSAHERLASYSASIHWNTRSLAVKRRPGRFSPRGFSSRAHIIGVAVSDTASDTRIATESVTANSRKRRPTIPPMSRMGMNTAISEKLIDSTVKLTSFAPSSAAWKGVRPRSMWRETFSSTTIASSTTNPVAMVSAIRDRLFRLNPARYITPKVATSETGTATAGMSVARALRRNTNTTRITNAIAISSVRSTSRSDARMVLVRSSTTSRLIARGIDARSKGMRSRTRSAVSMMLAFGCRLMMRSTEGFPFEDPALRRSSTESTTSATSERRTAAPLR